MATSRDNPDHGITRLDLAEAGTHGWQVRLQRQGVRHTRFFADRTWGGPSASLLRARDFRDRLLSRYQRQESPPRSHGPSARNRSGVVGVSRVQVRASNGLRYESWQATWSPRPGERKRARFSVLRYGDEEAFRLACEARRLGISKGFPGGASGSDQRGSR